MNKKSLNSDGSLTVEGKAFSSLRDSEKEAIYITEEAFNEALPVFLGSQPTTSIYKSVVDGEIIMQELELENNGAMKYHHGSVDHKGNYFGDKNIGQVLNGEWAEDGADEMAIFTSSQIKDESVVELIMKDESNHYSFSWYSLVREYDNERAVYIDKKIRIVELTVTPTPAGVDTSFEIVEDLSERLQGYVDSEVEVYGKQANVKSFVKDKEGKTYAKLNFVGIQNIKSEMIVPIENIKSLNTFTKESSLNDFKNMKSKFKNKKTPFKELKKAFKDR